MNITQVFAPTNENLHFAFCAGNSDKHRVLFPGNCAIISELLEKTKRLNTFLNINDVFQSQLKGSIL